MLFSAIVNLQVQPIISWHIALLCLRKIQYAAFPHPHFCKEKRLLVKPAGVALPIKILRCSLLQKFEIIFWVCVGIQI